MKNVFFFLFMMAFAFTANTNAADFVFDFAGYEIGDNLPVFEKNNPGEDATATIAADPESGGTREKCVHVVTTDYDAFMELEITLPAGKTIADYGALKFDLFVASVDYKQMHIYVDGVRVYADGGYPAQGKANAWDAKKYSIEATSDNPVTLAFGISTNAGDYYISNIRLEEVVPPSAYTTIDFEDYTLGADLPVFEKNNPGDATATVVADPAAGGTRGQCAHIVVTNWDAFIELTITLPEGKTLANYEEISYDQYTTAQEYKKTNIYVDRGLFYADDDYPSQGQANAWVTKNYSLDGATSGNPVALAFGMSHDGTNYYIDNVKLKARDESGIQQYTISKSYFSNNTLYVGDAQTAKVSVYDMNGRLLRSAQNAATVDLSNLTAGIYIAKIMTGNQAQILKFAK